LANAKNFGSPADAQGFRVLPSNCSMSVDFPIKIGEPVT